MWIRYRKLASHPEGILRVRDVVFNLAVNGGAVQIDNPTLLHELLLRCKSCGSSGDFEVAMEKYVEANQVTAASVPDETTAQAPTTVTVTPERPVKPAKKRR